MKRAWSIYKSTGVDFSCEFIREPEKSYPAFKKTNYSRFKTLSLLTLTLFCAISAMAQPWIVTAPGSIYYNQGNVGIGTSSPYKLLTVAGQAWINRPTSKIDNNNAIEFGGRVEFNNEQWNTGTASYLVIRNPDAGTVRFGVDYDGHIGGSLMNIQFGTINIPYLHIQNNGTNAGYVGIGTTSPAAKLGIESATTSTNSILLLGDRTNVGGKSVYFSRPSSGSIINIQGSEYGVGGANLALQAAGGNVGIGTINPTYKLDVLGSIRAKEIKVELNGADFVFDKEYKLMPLSELETFINEQKHLPDVAPAKEMQEKGTDLGDLNSKLLQKIEELTLYAIVQNKSIKEQVKKNEELAKKIDVLEKAVNNLISK